MNPSRFAFLVFAACVMSGVSVWGQTWQDITGNISGGIPLVQNGGPLASDGTYLYVNTGLGVARTTNGATFTPTGNIEGGSWRFVKVVNDEVWVGDAIASGHFTYLWRSSNRGDTWNAASNGMPGDVDIISLEDVTYDEDAGTYWAASRIGGVYRSNDGTNWTQNRVGLPQIPFFPYTTAEFVVANDGDAMAAIIGDGTIVNGGVFRSQNDGASWSKRSSVVAGDPGNFLKIGNRILYTTSGINTITGGLYITEDFGETWTFQDQWLKTAYSLSTDGTIVFACIGGGIWYSGNQGDSWEKLDATGLPAGWNAVAIERVGNYLFLFSSENNAGKVYRLDVSGFGFPISTQITKQPVGFVVIEGNEIALSGDAIGDGAVTYQWKKDGVNIPGATSKDLVIDTSELTDEGLYTLVATASGGSVESAGAYVTVKERNIGTVDTQFDVRFAFGLAVTADVYDVLVDSDGNVWMTGDIRSSGNRTFKLNPTTGEILFEVASAASGRSLAEDSEGKIWVGTNNAWLHRVSKSGSIDFTVDIKLGTGSGRVNEIVPYGDDGKVFIAGLFDKVGTVTTGPVALLNHDGTVDTSFVFDSANIATTDIADIDVNEDGSVIVVTETFTTNSVRKLNSDGSVDTNWWLGGKRDGLEQGNVNGDANHVKILPSGKMLVGFNHTSGTNTNVVSPVSTLMRFNADGTWDSTFNPGGSGPGGEVLGVFMAPDGKIVVTGNFQGYNVTSGVSSVNRRVTRLLADGTPDPYWNPGGEGQRGTVYVADFDEDGNVFVGTDHTWYNGVNLNRMLKLVGDVAPLALLSEPESLILDLGETATFKATSFGTTPVSYQWRKDGVNINGATGATYEIADVGDDDDGYYDVIISNTTGGSITSAAARLMTISTPKFVTQPEPQNALAGDEITLSVDAIGLGDLTYQWYFEDEAIAGATGSSYTIGFANVAHTGDYYVKVTGSAGSSDSDAAIVKIDPFAGALDQSFYAKPGFNQIVYDMEELDDGSLVVGGYFSQYNGVAKQYLAKVDRWGTLDADWPAVAAPNIWIRSIEQQSDGKLILAGPFTNNAPWPNAIARMNLDGTFDTTFNSGNEGFSSNSGVMQVAIQEDGKILVLVDRAYNANPTYNGETVADLFRINADGTIDETYNQLDTNTVPIGMKLLRSGKLIVYGDFTNVNGETINRLIRLNTDGTIDSAFALGAGPDQRVLSVDEAADGKIVVGGWFSSLGGFDRRFVALLDADGSVNEAFNTSSTGGSYPTGTVEAVSALLNGDVLITGNFLSWGAAPQGYPYRIATVNRLGQKTGFTNSSHFGFSSNPGNSWIQDGPGYAYIGGMGFTYHGQGSGGLIRVHLESMDLVFLAQPEDQYIEAGETATFMADVLGTTTVGYQWYKNGSPLPGKTSATLEIANAQESDEGDYTLVAVNASGEIATEPVALRILAEPEIQNEPVGKVASAGTTVSLVADGLGASPLTVQWYRNDIAIGGADSATLLLQGVDADDAGLYHAVFTNGLGTTSTRKVAVSVQYGAAGADASFVTPNWGSPSFSYVGVAPDGSYRIAGAFNAVGHVGLNAYYAAIGRYGTPNSSIYLQPYQGFFLGNAGIQAGNFNAHGVLVGLHGSQVFRVAQDGVMDADYDTAGVVFPNYNSPIIEHLDDGAAFVADMNYLVKLKADGTIDSGFNSGGAGPVGDVAGLAVSASGKVFIYGSFTSYNGVTVPGMAMLKADGSLDETFVVGTGVSGSQYTSPISCAMFAPDGKLYVGGNYTQYKGTDVSFLFRLNDDGSLDTAFAPGAFGGSFAQVTGLLRLPDGTLLVRGTFSQYAGVSQSYVVALDEAGAKVAHSIGTGLNGPVVDWKLESTGSIVMVGGFFSPKNRMMRLNPTPPDLEIVGQPLSFVGEYGETARLEVAAVGEGPLTFQWKKNGQSIDGATNFYLEFDALASGDKGTYTVTVSNNSDAVDSDPVTPEIGGFEPTPFNQWMLDNGATGTYLLDEEDDYDGDGIPNGAEYALGLDPAKADADLGPKAEFVRGSDLGLSDDDLYLVMTVRLKRDAASVTATPRAAMSVDGLDAGAANVVTISGPVADGDFNVYKYRSSFGVGSEDDAAFMDVKFTIAYPGE